MTLEEALGFVPFYGVDNNNIHSHHIEMEIVKQAAIYKIYKAADVFGASNLPNIPTPNLKGTPMDKAIQDIREFGEKMMQAAVAQVAKSRNMTVK